MFSANKTTVEVTIGCRDVGERRNRSLADESTTFNLGLFKTLGCNSREKKVRSNFASLIVQSNIYALRYSSIYSY